jgi:hypothetical protein
MERFVKGFVMAAVVAGLVGVASQSLAADKVECAITKNGKQSTQMVATRQACEKLGGKVAVPKATSTPKKN